MAEGSWTPVIGSKVLLARECERDGVPGYEVLYPPVRGNEPRYLSWSPKDVFETCYRPLMEGEAEMVKNPAA